MWRVTIIHSDEIIADSTCVGSDANIKDLISVTLSRRSLLQDEIGSSSHTDPVRPDHHSVTVRHNGHAG
jgi:hypothetical protein